MKLQTRFLLVFLPVLVLSGAATTLIARRAVHKALIEEAAERGQAELGAIASSVVPGLQSAQEDLLLPILTSVIAHGGAAYVMVLDAQGKVLAHTNVVEKGKQYTDSATREALAALQPTYHEVPAKPYALLDVSWPIWSPEDKNSTISKELRLLGAPKYKNRLGTLRMGLRMGRARLISHQLGLLLAIVGIFLLGSLLLLVRSILQPIGRLVLATEGIGQGLYGAIVSSSSASELANLASKFNQMSAALAETTVSKKFLDTILNSMREPLIVLDSFRQIRVINRAALEMLGYTSQELIGKKWDPLWGESSQSFLSMIEAGNLQDKEVLLKTKTGNTVSVLLSVSTVMDQDEKRPSFILVAKIR